MRVHWAIEIAGIGASLPVTTVTNHDFARRIETSDEWIAKRTGIRERRVAGPGETTMTLAVAASREAIQNAGLTPSDIDLIINATITPDHVLPSTSCQLQDALGCRMIPSFDLVAACSGYVYGLITAAQFIHCGVAKNVLVVGAECLTRMTDMEDRATAVLFGDGAAATVLRPSGDPTRGVFAARMGADGSGGQMIWVPAGGAAEPASQKTLNERLHYIRMKGRDVYKFAVTQMQQLVEETLAEVGLGVDDIALYVPHQSNLRIIESACERLRIPLERVVINIDRFGNTSAASVPLALYDAQRSGRLRRGDHILLIAFGAGLTWASALMRI